MGRLQTIDALRGVAALFVLLGHAATFFDLQHFPRFWLAVDLFFLISGYVLAAVYEPRFREGLTATAFLKARLLRLYPLYLVGLVVGIISAIAALALKRGDLSAGQFVVAVLSGLLMLPSPTWAGDDSLFPLNFPAWSLFFELVANLALALLWRRLTTPMLLLIVATSAAGMLAYGDPGAGESWSSILGGIPRVGFSFFLGVLIQRYRRPSRSPGWSPWFAVAGLATVLWLRNLPGGALADFATVVLVFPAILWLVAEREPKLSDMAQALGAMSYPLYVIHAPLISIITRGIVFFGHKPEPMAPWLGIATVLSLCGLALLLDRFYDRWARMKIGRWITRR
ncbi:acyltransferase family protein [Rhizorhabdus sp. FW153]|uniref:acyltransferase family protein n=1 Tax=Rhizorhabdus sp. FW153 TaxID=3400216 RepID=UPI003CEA4BC9